MFETSKELLIIPKLPIKITAENVVKDNINIFRKIDLGLDLNEKDINTLETIEKTLINKIDNTYTLSEWGTIVFDKAKEEIYKIQLLESPYNKIKFNENFIKSVNKLSKDKIFTINTRIDDLIKHFIYKNHNPDRLNFKKLKELLQNNISDYEFYAWSDEDAKRCYGHFENDIFIIDSLGNHL